MSEYQYVAFRAIDGPVSEENLDFMRRQSSRAEVTPWSFENEYHHGDFRGDAVEMLRRGYDLHLHYANYGTRTLMIRLPHGLPDTQGAKPYFTDESLSFSNDKQGRGGIVRIQPFLEPGDLDDLWEVGAFFDRLIPLRGELLDGDFRPLYLAHLAVACDGNHDPTETTEAPVPAGLNKLSDAQGALAELYGLSEALIAAAACNSPPLQAHSDPGKAYADWLRREPEARKDAWLANLMADSHSTVRREILAEFQKGRNTRCWPTAKPSRTIAALHAAAEQVQRDIDHQNAERAARQRTKRLADLRADPMRIIRETEELVAQRSTQTYGQVAALLADLRDALADSNQSHLPEQQARKLKDHNPTLHKLTAALRRQGFVKK